MPHTPTPSRRFIGTVTQVKVLTRPVNMGSPMKESFVGSDGQTSVAVVFHRSEFRNIGGVYGFLGPRKKLVDPWEPDSGADQC